MVVAKDDLKEVLEPYRGERQELINILQDVQKRWGYLPPEAMRAVVGFLRVPESAVYGVATFYSQFKFVPQGRHTIKVCLGTACHVQGGEQMLDVLERRLEIKPGETSADGEYDLERVACLGCCALAPVVTVDEKTYSQMSVLKLQGLLDERENTNRAP